MARTNKIHFFYRIKCGVSCVYNDKNVFDVVGIQVLPDGNSGTVCVSSQVEIKSDITGLQPQNPINLVRILFRFPSNR